MPSPQFEFLGVGDGVTTVFTTSVPYTAGAIGLWVRHLAREKSWDDGFFETDPDAGIITLKIAPMVGDAVQVFYFDQTDEDIVIVRDELIGTLEQPTELCGSISDDVLLGCVEAVDEMNGEIDGLIDAELSGDLEQVAELSGELECEP